MAKFCTKCGHKLQNDEVCACEKVKKENVVNEQEIDIFSKISEFLKRPVDCLKNKNFLEGNDYLILLLSSLSFGLINYLMPLGRYFRNFIAITILSFLFFILFAFIISVIRKQENGYNDTFKIVSMSSIILLFGNVITLLFSFVSNFISIIIMMFSCLMFILYCYQGLLELDHRKQNSIAYELTISILITVIIMIVCITIL